MGKFQKFKLKLLNLAGLNKVNQNSEPASPVARLEFFHATLDNLLEGCQVLGFDWKYIYLNKAARVHNRRSNQELIGNTYTDMWPGIESTHVFSELRRCMEERMTVQLENRFVFPNGSDGWYNLSIQPIPEGILILSHDITNRKHAESQLIQIKRLYATLSQINQTILLVKDRESLYRSICEVAVRTGELSMVWIGILDESTGNVNPVAARGLDVEKWPFPIVNIRDENSMDGLAVKAITTSQVVVSEDIQTDEKTKNLHEQLREYLFHAAASVPFRLKEHTVGAIVFISGEVGFFKSTEEIRLLEKIGLDISFALDSIEIEKEKSEAEKTLRLWADAFRYCAHGIAIGLPSGNLLACNAAFAEMMGVPLKEVSNMPIMAMYDPADHDRIRELIARADRHGHVQFETVKQRKDGTVFQVQMDLVSVYDDSGNLMYHVATQQDITARKKAEDDILQLNAELENRVAERTVQLQSSVQELEAYSYSVSHDLRTPLRGINGFAQILLEDHAPNLGPEGRTICNFISENSLKMSKLIDDLLEFSRLSHADLVLLPVDMKALVSSVFVELTPSWATNAVELHLGDICEASGDVKLLRQVWANLLSNAIKYSAKRDKPVITVSCKNENGYCTYSIRDNGVGFDMKDRGKLFRAFHRLHNTVEFEGFGVGLAIVQRIVARHGGKVWAEGVVDQGACFSFSMPIEDSH